MFCVLFRRLLKLDCGKHLNIGEGVIFQLVILGWAAAGREGMVDIGPSHPSMRSTVPHCSRRRETERERTTPSPIDQTRVVRTISGDGGSNFGRGLYRSSACFSEPLTFVLGDFPPKTDQIDHASFRSRQQIPMEVPSVSTSRRALGSVRRWPIGSASGSVLTIWP